MTEELQRLYLDFYWEMFWREELSRDWGNSDPFEFWSHVLDCEVGR